VCINHNLWQRRCHAYQSCPPHPAHLSPIQPDPLHPSPAIWHNNAGKWSMTRIQESRNPRIQGSCNCRRLSILLLLDESFLQGESRSVPLVPMLHFTQLVAFPRVSAQFLAGDQLYVLSKYFVSFFFGVDVAWTVDQRQLVGQLLWLDFAMPGVGVLLVGGLGGSTSGTGPLDGSVNSFKVSLAVHNYGLICSLKQAQLITATNSPFFSS